VEIDAAGFEEHTPSDLNGLGRDKTENKTTFNQNAGAFSQRLFEPVQISRREKLVRQNRS
jgi:hypothetical protein